MQSTISDQTKILSFILILTLLAIAAGIGVSISQKTIYFLLVAIMIIGVLLMANAKRVTLLTSLMILSAPYYQYRFDVPGIPFHLTVHRIFLLLAFGAVLLAQNHQSKINAPSQKRIRSTPVAMLATVWILAWFTLEIIASARSIFALGLVRLLPRTVGLFTLTTIVIYATDIKRIRWVLIMFGVSAILPAVVAIWQMSVFLSTGTFPGVPLQDMLINNLSIFAQAYKGAQFTVAPGIGILPRPASVMVDPNYLSAFLSEAILAILGTIILRNKISSKKFGLVISTLIVLILLSANLITFSRSGMFGLLTGTLVIMFLHPGIRKFRSSFIQLMLLGITLYGIYWVISIQTFGTASAVISSRYSLTGVESGANDRLPAFIAGLNAFLANPVFGVGAINMLKTSRFFTAHSSPITILAEFGLVGFILMYGMILKFSSIIIHFLANKTVTSEERFHTQSIGVTVLAMTTSLVISTIPYDHLLTLEVNWVVLGVLISTGIVFSRLSEEMMSCHYNDETI